MPKEPSNNQMVSSTKLSDGIIHHKKGPLQTTVIEKVGSELRLKLISPESNEWQSRIDLNSPNVLLSPYMQAMMLALLWNEKPVAAHVLGLGGGRIPTFLRHHFADLFIDCTEIDPDVYDLAKKYFEFKTDAKLRVIIQDGREYLANRSADTLYDIIFMDGFRGVGFSPLHLATQEFFRECKLQLQPTGVLVVNVLLTGGFVAERIATVRSVFRNVSVYHGNGALVVFGSDIDLESRDSLLAKAQLIQAKRRFDFPFESIAQSMITLVDSNSAWKGDALLLTDAIPPESIPIPEKLKRHIGRNETCPCGSGRKFKKCHGMA